jgi:hypothetical protein
VQAWFPGVVFACLAGILAGTVWLDRARGMRIVSGRSAAVTAYVWLFAAAVLASLIACLLVRVYPIVSANPDLSSVVLPITAATGVAVAGGLACLWRRARSHGRSVIFHNVRRDELAVAVAATLRELGVPAAHRLRIFRDDFVLPQGRLVVHSAVCMSRLEWIGSDESARGRVLEAVIDRLKDSLHSDGRVILDKRGSNRRVAELPAKPEASFAPQRA